MGFRAAAVNYFSYIFPFSQVHRRMTISLLLLESDESARATYTRALRDAGCTVSTAADSAHAYTAALAEMPDVIVVGFDPSVREDRFELCKRLGADPRTRQVPILLTSAVVNQNDLELATSTGVLALVLESRDAAKLVSAVRGVVAARLKPPPLRVSLESPAKDDAAHKNKSA
jgi:CheY-like chemotaxis protein